MTSEQLPLNEPILQNSSDVNYLELLYATLFHPLQTYRCIAEMPSPTGNFRLFAVLTVIFISALAPIIQMANAGGNIESLILFVPLSTAIGMIFWTFTALLIGLLAYAFTGTSRIQTFLTLSALATLPWLFMGPISILRIGLGSTGLAIGVLLTLLVWLWSVLLFTLALAASYRLTLERALIILAAPFVMCLMSAGWVVGFFSQIRQLSAH